MDSATSSINIKGTWDAFEHQLFLECLHRVPPTLRNRWKAISRIIKTRTATQVRTYAQKYFRKLRVSRSKDTQRSQSYDTSSVQRLLVEPIKEEEQISCDVNSFTPNEIQFLIETLVLHPNTERQ